MPNLEDRDALVERVRVALRRAGGLPRLARAPGGTEKVLEIVRLEAAILPPTTSAGDATNKRSTPDEQAKAIAHGHALDAEDGGYPQPGPSAGDGELVERMKTAADLADAEETRYGKMLRMAAARMMMLADQRDASLARVKELEEALQEIARQRTSLETVIEDEFCGGDFVDGYDCCINRARSALNPSPTEQGEPR